MTVPGSVPKIKSEEKDASANNRLPADGKEANQIIARARHGPSRDRRSSTSDTVRMLPPLLYDLTELQRHANRLYGFSAQKTLDLAQALYEQHKLISYPRTDSRYLSTDIAETVPKIVSVISGPYQQAAGSGNRRTRSWASVMSTTARLAIITPSFPPRLPCSQAGSPMRRAKSTTWFAGACS